MSEITKEALKAAGWRLIEWNGGELLEFWKPWRRPKPFRAARDSRLAVRLNWHPDDPLVWIIVPGMAIGLEHITTMEQLDALYQALKHPEAK